MRRWQRSIPVEKEMRNGPYVPQFYDNQFDLAVEELSVKLGDFAVLAAGWRPVSAPCFNEYYRPSAAGGRKVFAVTYCRCVV